MTTAAVQIIGTEQGFTGVVLRAHLSPVAGSAPRSVIVKLPLAARPAEAASTWRTTTPAPAQASRAAREVWCYQQLAANQPTFPGPRLHAAATNVSPNAAVDDPRVVLVLEDVASGSAVAGDALHGCMPQQAWQVLERLSDWHAANWASPRLDALAWLPVWGMGADDDLATAAAQRQARLTPRISHLLATHPDAFSADQHALLYAFQPQIAASVRTLAAAPRTAIHADLHLDNVLFSAHPAHPAPTATIIDWQSISSGPAAVDVAAFLSASLSAEDYAHHAANLRRAYHARLLAHGVRGYPADRFERDARLALLLHLCSLLSWRASSDPGSLPPDSRERALLAAILTPGWALAAAAHDLPHPHPAALAALLQEPPAAGHTNRPPG